MYQNCGDACSSQLPGMERPVEAHKESERQIRHGTQVCDIYRNKVENTDEDVPRKAAIAYMIPVP